MAIDLRRLSPAELIQVLNSRPTGEVLKKSLLARHRARHGLKISDGRRIDFLKYFGWLLLDRHTTIDEAGGLDAYERRKAGEAARQAEMSLSGRDIGELPDVINPARRQRCAKSLKLFCEEYFPQTFEWEWSDDHLRVLSKIEKAVLEGDLFAMAMPRGSGKTSMCEAGCVWAISYGYRRFVVLVGADAPSATDMLDSIKVEFEVNDRLGEDFPEITFPIRAMEGISQRASGQLYHGAQTHIGWRSDEVVMPTIPGSAASGSIIKVAGITGRLRGMKHKRIDGVSIRPSLVLIDDIQTDESAKSLVQCETRERVLSGAILGLAGPGKRIAGLMTVSVIRQDDVADRILNRELYPQWQGERTKMVYAWPIAESLWAEYAEKWHHGMETGAGISLATEFYAERKEAMDAGAIVGWAARKDADELSAIQNAWNLRLKVKDPSFMAEYQNDPIPDHPSDDDLLTADEICRKVNNRPRGQVPVSCTHLGAFIDVQGKALFWMVIACEPDFTTYVIDYGTEPEQRDARFDLRTMRKTLQRDYPKAGPEGAIRAGLTALCTRILGKEWRGESGRGMKIERCLIDANWGEMTDCIYKFCRESIFASVLTPSHGQAAGASSKPFNEVARRPGERLGLNWRLGPSPTRAIRRLLFDTYYWKSFVHARISTPIGDPGALSLFGNNPDAHRLLSEHLTAEFKVRTTARRGNASGGREVDEWKSKGPNRDNHWFDTLTGSAVAISIQGVSIPSVTHKVARPKARPIAEIMAAGKRM